MFSARVKDGGLLIHKQGLDRDVNFSTERKLTYSLSDTSSDAYARNITIQNGAYRFDVVVDDVVIENIDLPMGGLHNIENAVACITVAHKCGINDDAIRNALSEFKGVKRRFEYVVRTEKVVMIDDYAHHPQELSALIGSAKSLYPSRKCTVIFQPHLYTRTRDFAEGFAASLNVADEVVLLPVYPARELPIEGVESQMLADKMKMNTVYCLSKDEMLRWVEQRNDEGKIELLITAGAGDIDTLVPQLQKMLENKK